MCVSRRNEIASKRSWSENRLKGVCKRRSVWSTEFFFLYDDWWCMSWCPHSFADALCMKAREKCQIRETSHTYYSLYYEVRVRSLWRWLPCYRIVTAFHKSINRAIINSSMPSKITRMHNTNKWNNELEHEKKLNIIDSAHGCNRLIKS